MAENRHAFKRQKFMINESILRKKSFILAWIASAWLLLSGAQCSDVTITTKVDSTQKISPASGNLGDVLVIDDQFGSALATIGDLEGDGVIDLAVGEPFDDDEGPNRGALWILIMDSDGRVDLKRKISDNQGNFPADLDDEDHFGSAVVGIGDLDADGAFDLAVGAPLDDDGGTDRGAVWILFMNADGTVKNVQKISDGTGGLQADLDNGDRFGGALANLGDLDGDGITDLAAGAEQDGDGGPGTGAVWILFMNTDGTVKQTQKISSESGGFGGGLSDNDHFGSALAGVGDLNQDGVSDLIAGANLDDDGGPDRGALWVLFLNTDGTVNAEQKLSQTKGGFEGSPGDGDRFGSAVADIGDLNEDGVTDLAVGADQSDDGGTNRGAVWILFMDNDGSVISSIKVSSTEGGFDGVLNDESRFGAAVAGVGNLDNDEARDIAVGSPLDDDGAADSGAAWILFMKRTKTRSDRGFHF